MSSAASIASASESEFLTQDWEGFGTQEEAPLVLDSGVRGVGAVNQTDEIIFGETIVFIPSQSAAAKVCGARVGSSSGKKCIILKKKKTSAPPEAKASDEQKYREKKMRKVRVAV
eukprot:CAMPEP_0170796858 /NCGR_PEP_ID=MMETSP0733-20121128/25172_1 /TAXON_ID=186038 /ORGANISM="Fragilariopsis kerguelensis, Strain L26-C5" /LENGTH=114 /DNA_ID=CAMNT_0011147423 /DNA_START=122 /DNA_END=467 /DNA_ORIENTATION=-